MSRFRRLARRLPRPVRRTFVRVADRIMRRRGQHHL